MLKIIAKVWLLVLAGAAFAGFAPGENILANGEFSGQEVDHVTRKRAKVPENWFAGGIPGGAENCLTYFSGGVPSGKGYVHLEPSTTDKPGLETTVSQSGLYLIPGEKYRISALVRTKDFESPHCGIMVYDIGWYHDIGISEFPKNQDWTRMSYDFEMIPSTGNNFTFVIFACDFKGALDVTDVKLEALTEKGLKESKGSEVIELMKRVSLIPWKPLLNKIAIPKHGAFDWLFGFSRPEMTFLLNGPLPKGTNCKDYELHFAIDGQPEEVVPLQSDFTTIHFPKDVKPGVFKLKLSIVSRKDGSIICAQEHEAEFVNPLELSDKGHKRLNNLVVELLDKSLEKNEAEQMFEFCTMRDGWVFIAVQPLPPPSCARGFSLGEEPPTAGTPPLPLVEIELDSRVVVNAGTPRMETFREISAGYHKLTVKGACNGGRLIVRSIPEIYSYCPGLDPAGLGNPSHDWAFQEKYVLPALTTQNGGEIPKERQQDYFARGYKWICNVGTFWCSSDTVLERLNTCEGMNWLEYQGVSCDEQLNGAYNSILPFTDAIKRFVPKNDHVTYTWVGGQKFLPGNYDSDFVSACVNACHGRGRIIFESYNRTFATREEAAEHLKGNVTDIAAKYRTLFPDIMDHFGVILGNFNQIPVITLAHHTDVDYKYYLDMQFNLIANHPSCKDMAITGYWGTLFTDDEMARWSFLLTRHYCIEGKKTMLSDEYGFSYAPGHLRNGDFIDGLAHWTPTGNVTVGKKDGYAICSQNRYDSKDGQGDTFAVLAKNDSENSSLTQVAKGLVPGKCYCLQFLSVDYNDLTSGKFNPRRIGVDATLDNGAEIDKAASWLHIDRREKGNYIHNNNVPKCNLHHIVFKALKPEVTVTIHNNAAQKGEAAAVNYVTLNPYLAEP